MRPALFVVSALLFIACAYAKDSIIIITNNGKFPITKFRILARYDQDLKPGEVRKIKIPDKIKEFDIYVDTYMPHKYRPKAKSCGVIFLQHKCRPISFYRIDNSPDMDKMDETFAKVVQFFMTFVADNCKKSTVRELPNIMGVYNLFGFKNHTNQSLVSKISDLQMSECLRRGLQYIKAHISQLQAMEDGIPVTGGSIESWRFENIALDIISQDTRLHNTADFDLQSINVNMAEGKFHIVARWPAAHLTETYILRGSVDNKRVYGAGRFRITVVNFVMTTFVHFQEEESTIKIKNIVMTSDFEDARINISGLEVEGNENAEQLMNNAIQRDKQKFREILHRNMDLLSKEVLTVLNSKLVGIHKNAIFNLIASWCNL